LGAAVGRVAWEGRYVRGPYLRIIVKEVSRWHRRIMLSGFLFHVFKCAVGEIEIKGKKNTMNNHLKLQIVFALATLLLIVACSSESNRNQPVKTTTNTGTSNAPPAAEVKQRGNALVRVIDALPGGPAIDLFADDAKVFTDIAYKTTSPYKEVSGERHTFRIRPAGQNTAPPLAENSEGLGDGKHYTVVAMAGADGKPTLSVINDDLVPPSSGKAKVRILNASPDAGEVDVYLREGDKKLFGGVNALKETSYSEVDPAKGTLEVRPEGKNNAVLRVPNVKFDPDKIYTLVVLGREKALPKLEALVVEDQLGSATGTAPSEAASSPGRTTNTAPAANRATH
jgi:hypothetical protein